MRRAEREVKDPKALREILDACKVCRVALTDEQGIYIVPLNFGYAFHNGSWTLYFHSAKEGRKMRAIATSPQVAFEMDGAHRLIRADQACGHSFEYQSIVGSGRARILEDLEEKKKALALLMEQQTGMEFAITDQMAQGVAIFCIEVQSIAGKRNKPLGSWDD